MYIMQCYPMHTWWNMKEKVELLHIVITEFIRVSVMGDVRLQIRNVKQHVLY